MSLEFITIKDASGANQNVAVELVSGNSTQVFKVAFGADGVVTRVDGSNPLPVVASGTVAATQSGAWSVTVSGTTSVSDAGGSLTVDAPATTPVAMRLSNGTSFVDTIPVSAASLPLPTGAATETTLAALNGKVTTCNTGAVVLATGAATIGSVNQAGTWSVRNQDGSGNALTSRALGSARAQDTALVDGSGNLIGVSAAPVRVDPTGTTAQPVTVNAGTALMGQVAAGHQTDTIRNGTTSVVPKFAVINANTTGATSVVAAVAGLRIRVLKFEYQAAGAVSVNFRTGASTEITGPMPTGGAGGGRSGGFCPVGHFQTGVNEALSIVLSGSVAVGGSLVYVEV